MKQVDARILSPPILKYESDVAIVTKGVWQMRRFNYIENPNHSLWTILDLSNQRIELHNLADSIKRTG